MRSLQSRLASRLPFYYGWVIFGSVIGIAYSSRALMAVATLSVFLVPMTEHFGWSRGFFSGAVSLGGLGAVIISPFVGRVIDRYGSGAVLATISTITAICAIGVSLISQAWAFYALYVPGRAVFAGPLELGTSVTISNWFIRRRRLALSLLSIWQGTGLAIMPLVAQFIIVGWGWRVSWASLGLYTLAIGVAPPLLLMARRPEDLGMEPDGSSRDRGPGPESGAAPTQPGSIEARPAIPAIPATPAINEINLTVREALHTRAFWLLSLFPVAGFMVQAGVSLHQVPHFISQGLPGPLAALTASVFAISQTLGAIMWAILAGRIPLRFLLCLAAFTAAAGTIGIVSSSTLVGGLPAALALGVAVGGFHLLLRLIYADYYGRAHLGSIRGLTIGAQIGGQVLGPIIAGVMFDVTKSYWSPFLGFAVAVSLAGLVVLAATPPVAPTGHER